LADDVRAQDEGEVDEDEGEVKADPSQDEAASGEPTVSALKTYSKACSLLLLQPGLDRVWVVIEAQL
jgi:hypothetical protein